MTAQRLTKDSRSPLRSRGIGILRIIFGLVWVVIAWFKWQPDFIHTLPDYLSGAMEGQPPAIQAWLTFWLNLVKPEPHFPAYLVAIAETAIAVGLILGVFSNLTNLGGALLTLMIWVTAEGFGGPYGPGSTDIGAAIYNVFVFILLLLANAGLVTGIDQWHTPRLGRGGFLDSGPLARQKGWPFPNRLTWRRFGRPGKGSGPGHVRGLAIHISIFAYLNRRQMALRSPDSES